MTQETRSFVEACERHLEQEWELISRQSEKVLRMIHWL